MFERKKEQNEAEQRESAIDGMHVLIIPLVSVDSVLYPVFAMDCKQRTAFVAFPLCSNYSQHTLHVIESRESTPNNEPFFTLHHTSTEVQLSFGKSGKGGLKSFTLMYRVYGEIRTVYYSST